MRILAVDPGEKRIGVAISDESGTIARPLTVVFHKARQEDAAAIVRLAVEQDAGRILVGQALDDEGQPSPEGRKAARLAEALRSLTELPVELWDESGTTQAARAVRLQMGSRRKDRRGHLDDLAAAILLQDYLDSSAGLPPSDMR